MSKPGITLASLLARSVTLGEDAPVVAFERSSSGEERVTRQPAWRASVVELSDRLAAAKIGRGSRVALYDEDPLCFSLGLFALWTRGAVAVLPPNGQPGTFERLRAAVDASVGCDIGLGARATFEVALSASGEHAAREIAVLERSAPVLELFTSGTTGEGKAAVKRLAHLDDEVRALEASFGASVAGARVYATASHQHLYGLLFRVLWPLAAGRAFCRDRLLHAEELLPRLAKEASSVLASVPAHLDRMSSAAGFAQLAESGSCRVFSSGGPLPAATAHRFEEVLGDAPTEVFGSTETGGVAHRRQLRALGDDVAWIPFDGVRALLDDAGCLRVQSSIVSEGIAHGELHTFSMGDRAELDGEGRFRLRGRADRVLKIGEKRVSLPDMESRLRTHAAVADVALVAVSLAGQERLGAVVVPSEAGNAVLASSGRGVLGRELAEHLARDFDRVLVPRAWRYVEALPEDAQGKITQPALAALFEVESVESAPDASAEPEPGLVREPVCLEKRTGRDAGVAWIERLLLVSPDLEAFVGHFPGAPIVPGVVQISWAVAAACELLGFDAHPERIEALKFTSTLGPGARISLRVERREAAAAVDEIPARVQFRILRAPETGASDAESDAREEVSTGRLYLVRRTWTEASSAAEAAR